MLFIHACNGVQEIMIICYMSVFYYTLLKSLIVKSFYPVYTNFSDIIHLLPKPRHFAAILAVRVEKIRRPVTLEIPPPVVDWQALVRRVVTLLHLCTILVPSHLLWIAGHCGKAHTCVSLCNDGMLLMLLLE